MIDVFIVTKLSNGKFFNCAKSIYAKTDKTLLSEIVLNVCYTGDVDSEYEQLRTFLSTLTTQFNLFRQEYNFSKCNNMMVKNTRSEHLLFLNDDVELIDDCISHCHKVCQTGKFGTIGCKLLYTNGTIQHAGQEVYVSNDGSYLGVSHYLLKQQNRTLPDFVSFGNTGAFMMIERTKFPFFNENYQQCFEDVELNLKMLNDDFLNVTCGSVQAYHHESNTRENDKHYFSKIDLALVKNYVEQHCSTLKKHLDNLGRTVHFIQQKSSSETHKLTIVMPNYNKAEYVAEAIQSLFNQTDKNFKVVIVDDKSTDESVAIIKNMIKDDNRFQLIQKETNSGVAATRNVGIKAATTDYVLPLDADDMFEKTYVERANKFINEHPEFDLYYGKWHFFGEDAERQSALRANVFYTTYANLLKGNSIHCSCVFKRKHALECGLYDEQIEGYEDWEFLIRLLSPDSKVHYDQNISLLYRQHGISKTTADLSKLRKIYQYMQNKNKKQFQQMLEK